MIGTVLWLGQWNDWIQSCKHTRDWFLKLGWFFCRCQDNNYTNTNHYRYTHNLYATIMDCIFCYCPCCLLGSLNIVFNVIQTFSNTTHLNYLIVHLSRSFQTYTFGVSDLKSNKVVKVSVIRVVDDMGTSSEYCNYRIWNYCTLYSMDRKRREKQRCQGLHCNCCTRVVGKGASNPKNHEELTQYIPKYASRKTRKCSCERLKSGVTKDLLMPSFYSQTPVFDLELYHLYLLLVELSSSYQKVLPPFHWPLNWRNISNDLFTTVDNHYSRFIVITTIKSFSHYMNFMIIQSSVIMTQVIIYTGVAIHKL